MDGPGHYVYLRDQDTGDYWSISWQPVGKPQGAFLLPSRPELHQVSLRLRSIDAEQKLFVAMDDPVEIWDVKLRNDSDKVRHLSVFSYLEFSFHQVDMDNKNFQMSLYATGSRYEDGVIENDLYYEEDGYQFFTSDFTRTALTACATALSAATAPNAIHWWWRPVCAAALLKRAAIIAASCRRCSPFSPARKPASCFSWARAAVEAG